MSKFILKHNFFPICYVIIPISFAAAKVVAKMFINLKLILSLVCGSQSNALLHSKNWKCQNVSVKSSIGSTRLKKALLILPNIM